jgi:hypothetical protein
MRYSLRRALSLNSVDAGTHNPMQWFTSGTRTETAQLPRIALLKLKKRFLIRPRRTRRPRANDSGGRTLEAVPVQQCVGKSSCLLYRLVEAHSVIQPLRD